MKRAMLSIPARSLTLAVVIAAGRTGTGATVPPSITVPVRFTQTLDAAEAKAGDIVLIAGKGHEKVQTMSGGSVPFDDKQVAADVLREMGYEDGSATAGVSA